MKNIIVFALLLTMSATSFSQQSTSLPGLDKLEYLKKSRTQNTTAWFLAGSGVVLLTIAASIETKQIADDLSNLFSFSGEQEKTSNSADVFGYTGVACVLGSIPFFIAAHKNKKKAMSFSFKNQTAPQLQNGSLVNLPVPSLTLKVSF